MSLLRLSLLSLAVLATAGTTTAHARTFLGIGIGCDPGTKYSFCQGADIKPSMKRAIDVAVFKYVHNAGKSIFGPGPCTNAKLTKESTFRECELNENDSQMVMTDLEPALLQEIFKDKSIQCGPNVGVMNSRALSLNTLPRFDPYTGKEADLTLGQYQLLLKQAGQLDCANRK